MQKTIKIIDLFCGTGGFSHGFNTEEYLYELVYAIDYEPNAVETTKANHTTSRIEFDDIRKVDPKKIKEELNVKQLDLVIGGPPCQGFTSLRPHRSMNNNDERNNLFLNFIEFVHVFRPKMFILENVVGLITHEEGKTLSIILEKFSNLGYAIDWKILNAAHFGVPQKRERFVLMGSRDNGRIIFPEPTHYSNGRVIGHVDRTRLQIPNKNLPSAITVDEAIDDLPHLQRGESANKYDKAPRTDYQRARRKNTTELSLHIASNHSDKMMEVIRHAGDSISSIPKGLVTSGFSSCYSRIRGYEPSNTITVKFQSPASNKCIHPTQDRTITPREAARIQSFDDDYIFKGSLTQIASQIGNAVPPLLGKAISKAISRELI